MALGFTGPRGHVITVQGTYMQWPGMEDCSTGGFDPRFRPWYAGAAAGPKDVVIVIDTSGSMSSGNPTRMSLAIDAAVKVVDTLTDADYAAIVGFQSNTAKYRLSLQQATDANKGAMKSWIRSSLTASGGTNFRAAFDAVFEILQVMSACAGVHLACDRTCLVSA